MNDNVIFVIYKLTSILVGCLIVFWGYNLFKKGYNSIAGEFSGIWDNKKIILKNAAPGTFLILVGGAIVLLSVIIGMEVKSHTVQKKPSEKLNNQELISDTIYLSDGKANINIDSLFELALNKINEKKYLNSLKYLYYLKGYTSVTRKDDAMKKNIDIYIKVAESGLNEMNKKDEIFFDETKSSKINDENTTQDSLK